MPTSEPFAKPEAMPEQGRDAPVRTVFAYLWAVLFLAVVLPIGLLVYPFDRKQRYHDKLSVVWAKGVLWLLGVRVVVSGAENAVPGEAYVVASNHQSILDVLAALIALQGRVALRFVAKRSIFWAPIIGWGMRLYGHAPIARESVKGAVAGLERARRHVARRWSTFFFPEGTRTLDGKMLPFRLGAFRIAATSRARVLPITVDGGFQVAPKIRFAGRPGVMRVTVHPPMDPPDNTLASLRAAAAQCQQIIAGATAAERPA